MFSTTGWSFALKSCPRGRDFDKKIWGRGMVTGQIDTCIKSTGACYSGSLSKTVDVLQGTGQVRILAPLIYKVYINGLLKSFKQNLCTPSINSLKTYFSLSC